MIDVEGKYGLRWQAKRDTAFRTGGKLSQARGVIVSAKAPSQDGTEGRAGPLRDQLCSAGAVQNVATSAEVPWGETMILHFCPSRLTHF